MATQQLDRIITIQSESQADPRGPVIWTDLATVWASVRPQTATERFRNESNISQASNTTAFRVRWRSDLDETMRVLHEGHEWDIEGIIEVGRRRFLDLVATRS